MKYLRRYLSLLFALVMCVGLFSNTVHAKTIEYDNSNIYVQVRERVNGELFDIAQFAFNANDDVVEGTTIQSETDVNIEEYRQYFYFYLQRNNQTKLFSAGGPVEVSIENIVFSTFFYANNDWIYGFTNDVMHSFGATVYYTDNTTETVTVEFFRDSSGMYDVKIAFTPQKDVQTIMLATIVNFYDSRLQKFIADCKNRGLEGFYTDTHIGEVDNRTFNITIEQDSKEAGLLAKIGDKLNDGFEAVKNGFKAVTEGFSNVLSSIAELPQKLWNLISDGLKGLFVPSEESMTAYKDKWDELLSSRFGAVYQVVNIITDSWGGIMAADQTDTISFPQATLNFSGTPFTFGGYEVKIVPDGFGVLVTAIKSIVAIVCTVAFVNGLRKRYDEIMGVEQ